MTYDECLAEPGNRVVLFYGTSCPACEALKKVLRPELLAQGLPMVEINIAGELDAARRLGLRSVPAVVLVHDGIPTLISTPHMASRYILERLKGIKG